MANVLDDSEISRALVVMAHPDDVDFGAAGTVARWTARGIEVVYLLVTDGDAGGFDDDVPRERMAPMRRAEQEAAAAVAGVRDVRWLGYPDGRVEATLALRRDIARVIRQVRPDRVLTSSPDRDYTRISPSHPDHRAVGSATLDAVYPDARNPYAFPELLAEEKLEAWTAREVWLSAGPSADHHVDVTDEFDTKIKALRAHASQTEHMGDRLPEMVREWLTANAQRAGLPAGRLAEAFLVVPTA
ncbi:Mycothiol S-conjugate amidase [Actinomadura rubteroloni]|uniref:Mycothiol S-conjugate amidase n=1 Tax=Actinomadura rubteroloni TaxID=1926885 RepID=A0A2P4UJM3_9ACTN|nr:PIG-L deacetylase family protein [Actinomadura rubteroloni]POM25252.1 Mycothiol S-conjugate amidase [Actinomadura rubteroloni]